MSVNQEPKVGVGSSVAQFLDGALRGSNTGDGLAKTAGDIASALVPGLGEAHALRDVYDGLRGGNRIQLIAGLLGLIPVAGDAARATTAGARRAASVAAREVAEKGLTPASMAFSRAAAASARDGMRRLAADPKVKTELAEAGKRAYGRTMDVLQRRLEAMAESGRSPSVVTRDHASFIDARKSAFAALAAQPDASWQSLFVEDEAHGQRVIGKHLPRETTSHPDALLSLLGFRFIDPPEGGSDAYQLMWWKQPDEATDPEFGLESFQASTEEAHRIFDAYLNQSKTFGRVKSSPR